MVIFTWWLSLSSIRRAGFYNVLISSLSALASLVSLVMVAKYYGGTFSGDAYFFLISAVAISTGILGALFSSVFLPEFTDIKIREGLPRAIKFFNSLLSWMLIVVLPLAIFSFIFYEEFYVLISQFSLKEIDENKKILIYFSPIFFLSIFTEYLRVMQLALERYLMSAFVALFQPLTLIFFIPILSSRMGGQALSLSVLVSKLMVLLVLGFTMLYIDKVRLVFSLKNNGSVNKFVRLSAPYWSAGLVTNFATFYFDYLATGLGVGVLTAITCAQRVFVLPASLIINPILDIARVKLSEFRARGDLHVFASSHNELLGLVLYLSIPIAVIFFCIPEQIISTLFQRGSFGTREVEMSAQCLRILAITLPLSCIFILNGRSIEIFQRLLWPSFFGSIGNLALILATYFFVSREGFIGIPYARLATDLFYFLPLGFVFLRLYLGKIQFLNIFKLASIAIISASVPSIVLTHPIFRDNNFYPSSNPFTLLINVVFYGVLYFVLIILFDWRARRLFLGIIRLPK